jgi:hypothetical protein
MIKVGDRVHFKETPTMMGTVRKINEQGKYGVSWDVRDPNQNRPGPVPFYPKQHLSAVTEKKQRGNPNFAKRETNPAVIASANHPVFPSLTCSSPITIQIPAEVKLLCKSNPEDTGIDRELYLKLQFLIRKHALKKAGVSNWEEFVKSQNN